MKKKKKKKKFSILAGIAQNLPVWPVFKPVRNVDVSILVYIPASTGTVLTSLL